jgi:hypothetical protein
MHPAPKQYMLNYECKDLYMPDYARVKACKFVNSRGNSYCEVDWRLTIPCEFYDGVK